MTKAEPISIRTTRRGSGGGGADAYNTYEAHFKESPDDATVAAAQEKHGYHPAGYGGPMRITRAQVDGSWKVTWQSFASCD